MKQIALLAGLTLTALLAGGCLNTRPTTDLTRHFVLSPRVETDPASADSGPGLIIGLNPVDLPPYAQSQRLLVRMSPSEVAFLEDCRWAERLDRGVQRVLADNLSRCPPIHRVDRAPWRRDRIQVELTVSMDRFEVGADGTTAIGAEWHFGQPGRSEGWSSGRTELEQKGPSPYADPAGAVATLSDLLGTLSRKIAVEVGNQSGGGEN